MFRALTAMFQVGWFISTDLKSKVSLWEQTKDSEIASIRGVCFDIDDTFSTAGKITAEAYTALWKLKDAGYFLIPVTGRPAGWCDHIARFWPVDAVVGENGAFAFFMRDQKLKRIETPGAPPCQERRELIQKLSQAIQKKFDSVTFASDQLYREFDLAVDVCEDVPAWPDHRVQELIHLGESMGAHAKLSSIHVNFWFGQYDKATGLSHFLSESPSVLGRALPSCAEWVFIGDSPNDEPLFASFPFSVGVSNLSRFVNTLQHPPRWLTRRSSGEGFTDFSARLLALHSVLQGESK